MSAAAESPAESARATRATSDRSSLTLGIVWFIIYFGARVFLERAGGSDAIRLLIALAPLPPFLLFLRAFVRSTRDADELERRVQLEALALAFPLTVVMLMVLGLAELAFPLNRNDWSYRHVWAYLPLFYFGGVVLAWRRYR